jgi:hypothetical protein
MRRTEMGEDPQPILRKTLKPLPMFDESAAYKNLEPMAAAATSDVRYFRARCRVREKSLRD